VERGAGIGGEEHEAYDHAHHGADHDLGGDPSEVTEVHDAVEEEADEVTDEEGDADQDTPRSPTAGEGPEGEDHRERGEGQGPVAAEEEAEGHRGDDRERDDEGRDRRPTGRRVVDPDRREHPDQGAEQHGDHEQGMVAGTDGGGGRRRRPGRYGRLQGPGRLDEGVLDRKDDRDRDHRLAGGAEAVEARVGADDAVEGVLPGGPPSLPAARLGGLPVHRRRRHGVQGRSGGGPKGAPGRA
jgi:hypothetical protein